MAAFVTESWATATAVSSWTAKRLLANTLDLHHRLPLTWAAVDALELEAWRGCKIAEDTHNLSAEAAEWIDTELARLGRYGIPTIEKTIRSAIAKFHPDKLDNDPSPVPGKDQWDVTIDHNAGAGNGTSRLDAMGARRPRCPGRTSGTSPSTTTRVQATARHGSMRWVTRWTWRSSTT
ncbi:hypothetical protein [Nocardioides sp. Root140]|uniref:hypothetical protein n=1 Tax=Nocardioides sp. Root140 TaxID=1736460 RepID=UPI000713960C|nr:hypothetical protein [Nocardioides sp. Root140]KQY63845.1 hypothetical protein ASD30_02350 [Nocardioides sp. Root140]